MAYRISNNLLASYLSHPIFLHLVRSCSHTVGFFMSSESLSASGGGFFVPSSTTLSESKFATLVLTVEQLLTMHISCAPVAILAGSIIVLIVTACAAGAVCIQDGIGIILTGTHTPGAASVVLSMVIFKGVPVIASVLGAVHACIGLIVVIVVAVKCMPGAPHVAYVLGNISSIIILIVTVHVLDSISIVLTVTHVSGAVHILHVLILIGSSSILMVVTM